MKTDATKRIFLNAQLRKTTFKCFYLASTQFGRQLWGYIIIDLSIGISVNTFFLFFFCVAFFYATYDSHDKFSDIQYFNTDFRFQIVNLSWRCYYIIYWKMNDSRGERERAFPKMIFLL